MVHRNTYINGPTVLLPTRGRRGARDDLFFAGQVSGVEGYVESAASGLLAGRNAAALARGEAPRAPPRTTAIGALALLRVARRSDALPADQHHVRHHGAARRPAARQGAKKALIAERALAELQDWLGAPALERAVTMASRPSCARVALARRGLLARGDHRRRAREPARAPQGVPRRSSSSIATCRRTRSAPTKATSRSTWPGSASGDAARRSRSCTPARPRRRQRPRLRGRAQSRRAGARDGGAQAVRRCARSCSTCAARGVIERRPDAAAVAPKLRADDPGAPLRATR